MAGSSLFFFETYLGLSCTPTGRGGCQCKMHWKASLLGWRRSRAIRWQIENQSTCIALIVMLKVALKAWQEQRHQVVQTWQYRGMRLDKVFSKCLWLEMTSTVTACGAQGIATKFIFLQLSELPTNHVLYNLLAHRRC